MAQDAGRQQVPQVPLAPSGRNEATGVKLVAHAREHSVAEPSRQASSQSAYVATSVRVQQYLERQRDQLPAASTPTPKNGKAATRARGCKRSRQDAEAIQAVCRQRLHLLARHDAQHNTDNCSTPSGCTADPP